MNIPLIPTETVELHAELDRLDRELETMRARLATEQGALHEARARCRALNERPSAGEPSERETVASVGRRLARTSRLESTMVGSRGARVMALRPIPGGSVEAHAARPDAMRRPENVVWGEGPPDAA